MTDERKKQLQEAGFTVGDAQAFLSGSRDVHVGVTSLRAIVWNGVVFIDHKKTSLFIVDCKSDDVAAEWAEKLNKMFDAIRLQITGNSQVQP